MVLHKTDRIFAASKNKDVVELNMNLDVVKKFKGRDDQPLTIDACDTFLVVGYRMIDYVGYVDVHSRNELDKNGTYQKRTVSNFSRTLVSKCNIESLFHRNTSMAEVLVALLSMEKW